ncbi:MAG TPA: hypothetical protein VMW09_08490 [Desulfatiglandales bacterium]|nr:hypothetical protein [Desulfatiglandales bacterium]
MNNDTMLFRQKTDQPFQVDFAVILRYIALLTKKVAKIMNSVFEDYQLSMKNL